MGRMAGLLVRTPDRDVAEAGFPAGKPASATYLISDVRSPVALQHVMWTNPPAAEGTKVPTKRRPSAREFSPG